MTATRKIIHIDMDAYYASVEQRDFPELRGQPVVVGGRPGGRGVVAAASYEARKFGIRSAMPASQAHQRCPHAVFVRPRFDVYRQVSAQIRAIFHEVTDLVEPLSLDEAYLDVTENKFNNPSATLLANQIRARILETTQLTASAGVSANKFLAKVASDVNKPNGICVIPPERMIPFMEQLPIGKFYGIGKATEKRMKELGIHTGHDLAQWHEDALIEHFGKSGSYYYRIIRGQDNRPVSPHRERKSVGVEETFGVDLETFGQMENVLQELAAELQRRLGKQSFTARTITLKLRYANFETITRAKTLDFYTADARIFYETVVPMLHESEAERRKVRLLGLTAGNLEAKSAVREIQLVLPFEDVAAF